MIAGYVTEDVELDQGEEVSVLAQPDLLNVYIEDVSFTFYLRTPGFNVHKQQ